MDKTPITIGQSEHVDFPGLGLVAVPARIDTGARTSTIWASSVTEAEGKLTFCLFAEGHPLYDGKIITTRDFGRRIVTPSNGISEERYMVKLSVRLAGKRIKARFTLANRSTQKYPVLVGRNILRGKFIVDIKHNFVKPV
ncbi:MAG: RimK/LysX family protein [Candidatus Saccharimonadales bacterium]